MNARIVALLSNQNPENYSLTGDSLTGIDNRNSQQDFNSFFEQKNPAIVFNENQANTRTSEYLRLTQALSAPKSSVFFVPVQSFNGNDGTQVQFDLGNSQQ
jgi:hypothetical protein